jgi:hypothetical protein
MTLQVTRNTLLHRRGVPRLARKPRQGAGAVRCAAGAVAAEEGRREGFADGDVDSEEVRVDSAGFRFLLISRYTPSACEELGSRDADEIRGVLPLSPCARPAIPNTCVLLLYDFIFVPVVPSCAKKVFPIEPGIPELEGAANRKWLRLHQVGLAMSVVQDPPPLRSGNSHNEGELQSIELHTVFLNYDTTGEAYGSPPHRGD